MNKVEYLLREVREGKGVTVRKLAEMSGVSKNYICEIENGKANPTASVLCALATALEVPIDRIIRCEANKRDLENDIQKSD